MNNELTCLEAIVWSGERDLILLKSCDHKDAVSLIDILQRCRCQYRPQFSPRGRTGADIGLKDDAIAIISPSSTALPLRRERQRFQFESSPTWSTGTCGLSKKCDPHRLPYSPIRRNDAGLKNSSLLPCGSRQAPHRCYHMQSAGSHAPAVPTSLTYNLELFHFCLLAVSTINNNTTPPRLGQTTTPLRLRSSKTSARSHTRPLCCAHPGVLLR